jgi:Asp-tRNA(Asn)/Glu-tRNA(Gln) amidotransferase A subunit family amidase
VPSLREEMLTISNHTGHPSLTLPTGSVTVSETRSDWAPGSEYSAKKLDAPRRVPHGVTLIGRLFAEGTIARVGLALERHFGMTTQHPSGFGTVISIML